MSRITCLDPASYLRVPWKNGGGVSTTIAGERLPGAAPGDWSGVLWQLGRTAIATPAPFSDLTGFDRLQTVVVGSGLYLDTPAGAIDLSEPLAVAAYDGGTPIVSRLTAGPVEVVNLIARRDRARIAMEVLRPGDALVLPAAVHVLYAPTGAAEVALGGTPCALAEDHSVMIDGPLEAFGRAGVVIAASVRMA